MGIVRVDRKVPLLVVILGNPWDVEYGAFGLFAILMVPGVRRGATFFGMDDVIVSDEIGVVAVFQLSRTAESSPGSGIGDVAPFDPDLLPLAGRHEVGHHERYDEVAADNEVGNIGIFESKPGTAGVGYA